MEQSNSENTPIQISVEEIMKMSQESIASISGDEKKKESTEPSSSQQKEVASESTIESTEEEQPQPPKKKRGSVVSKKPNQAKPSESSTGKKDDGAKKGSFVQQIKEQKKEEDITGRKQLFQPRAIAKDATFVKMPDVSKQVTPTGEIIKIDPLVKNRLDIENVYSSFDEIIELDKKLQKKPNGQNINIELSSGYNVFLAGDAYKKEFNQKLEKLKNSALEIVKNDLDFTEKDVAYVENEYDKEKNRTGFFNKLQDFASNAMLAAEVVTAETTGVTPPKVSSLVKDDTLSNIWKELNKEDKKFASKTKLEQEQLVKERFIEDRTTSLMMSKYNAAAEKLTPQQRAAMSIYSTRLLAATNRELSKETDKITSIKSTAEALAKRRDELISLSKSIVAKDKSPDKAMVDEFNLITVKLKGLEADFDRERTKVYENSGKVKDLKLAVRAYNSETNEVADFLKRLKASGLGMAANIGALNIQFLKQALPEKISKPLTTPIEAGVEMLEKKEGEVRETLREVKDVNNVNDFLDYSLGFLGDNTLITLALISTGGAASTTLIAADTAGHTFRDLNRQNKEFDVALKKAEKENQKQFDFNGETYNVKEQKGKKLYSTEQISTNGILHGALMALPAAKQAMFLKSQRQIIQAIERRSPDLIANSVAKNIIDKSGRFLKEVGELDVIIRSTNVGNAVADNMVLGKKASYSEAFGKLDHTYTSFLLHSLNAGMGYAFVNQTVSPYIKSSEAKKMDLNTKIGMDALEKISDPNISAEDKAIYKKRLEDANSENQKIVEATIDKIGDLPKQDFDRTQKLINDSSEMRAKAEEIKKSNVPDEVKAQELEKLKKKYIATQAEIIKIQDSAPKRTDGFYGEDAKTQNEYLDNAKKELDAENKDGKEITERDIKYRALINYRDAKNPIEKNIYYYKGDVEPELPEGYTTVKKVENSVELDMYYRQQAKIFKTAEEIRAIPEADRTDSQKKSLVLQDFEKACSDAGISQVEIDAAVSIMEARAKASGSGDKWFNNIEVSEVKPEAKPEVTVDVETKVETKESIAEEKVETEVKPEVKVETKETVETPVVEQKEVTGEVVNPLKDVESTTKALDGVDTSDIKKDLGIEANWDMAGESDWLSGKSGEYSYTQRMLPDWNTASLSGEINPDSKLTYDIHRQSARPEVKLPNGSTIEGSPEIPKPEIVYAKDENGVIVGKVEMDSNGGILHLAVAPEFRGKGVAEKLIEKLGENNPTLDLTKTKKRSKGFEKAFSNKIISKEYHKAKIDGSNPKLVKAVEGLLATEQSAKEPVESKNELNANEAIEDGKRLINALNITDFKTMVNEISGLLRKELTPEEQEIFNSWAGTKSWIGTTTEVFSEGFEQYIMTGKAPTSRIASMYEKAAVFLKGAYEGIKKSPAQLDIPEEAIDIYDKMFLTEQEKQVNQEKELSLQRLNITSLEAKSLDIFQELKKAGLIKEIPC